MSLQLPAPAKLNLILRITGQRADGYHELQTLFQLLDFGDQLTFALRDDDHVLVDMDGPQIPLEENLVYRAARLLQEATGCTQGASIQLHKQLPAGGGIGGGSSDAATTLLALNYLWQLDLSLDELARIGAGLGADIPVFVRGQTAWAEGIGECLTPVITEPRFYLVIAPDTPVSTAEIFQHPGLTRDSAAITLAPRRDRRLDNDWLEQHSGNDCQALVESLYPEVAAALSWLRQFASAQLTGTGGCVFAPFDTVEEARQVLAQLPAKWRGFVACGVQESPAHTQLANLAADSNQ